MTDYVHKFLEFTVGNLFGRDITCREPVYRCDSYQPGVLVEFGRTVIRLFKKFMMPCGLCAVPIVGRMETQEEKPKACSDESGNKKLIKPSELPLYAIDDDIRKMSPCKEHTPSALEQEISKIRKSVQGIIVQYQNITQSIFDTIDTGFEHSRVLLDYVRDEENVLPRIGAVGIGGLTGLVLGLRGGKFKKLLYTTTGATTLAAVCYPKEAEEGLELAKHYANISYNFIYGVKPGDGNETKLELPTLPSFKMPTTFSEFLDMLINATSSAASAAGSLTQKAYKAITEKTEGKLDVRHMTFHRDDQERADGVEPIVLKDHTERQTPGNRRSWFRWK